MIYETIAGIAKSQHISISAIERECGFARGSMYKWNTHAPSVWAVKKVADLLGVPIASLLEEGDGDETVS